MHLHFTAPKHTYLRIGSYHTRELTRAFGILGLWAILNKDLAILVMGE